MKRALTPLAPILIAAGLLLGTFAGPAHATVAPCVGPSAWFQAPDWRNGATLAPGTTINGDLHVCSAKAGLFAAVVQFRPPGESQLWNVHSNVMLAANQDSGTVSVFYQRIPSQPGTYQILAILKDEGAA